MFSKRTSWDRQENELSQALEKLRASAKRVFDLTRSNPTECGFTYVEEKIRQALGHQGIAEYRPAAQGLASAREAICGYYRAQHAGFVTGVGGDVAACRGSEREHREVQRFAGAGESPHIFGLQPLLLRKLLDQVFGEPVGVAAGVCGDLGDCHR